MNIDQLLNVVAERMDEFDIGSVVQHYLFDLAQMVDDNQNQVIDLQSFVTFYVQRMEESGLDGLITITRLLQFYQDVRSQIQCSVQLKHITDYLIQSAEQLDIHFNKKFLPKHQIRTKKRQLIASEISPPEILGLNQDMLRRIVNDLKTIDTNSKTQIIQAIAHQNELFLLMQFQERISLFVGFEFQKFINLKKNDEGNYIQFISYGNERLGCVMRDLTIVFWDQSDGYQFDYKVENNVEISKLRYLHLQDQWISVNKQNQIMIWNLETANYTCITQQINSITEICEIDHLQMLLVISNPNIINCFDMFEQKFLFRFSALHNIITNLKYSRTFQLIFTIGLDSQICCYQLHTKYNDQNLKCQLKGHLQTISCIELLENTSLLVSIDCKNTIILWDIRSQQIHQHIKLQTKLMSKQLFYYNKCLCLITTRLQALRFEQHDDTPKNTKLIELIYDQWNQRNIIVTRTDVRIQNCINGKIEYILQDFKDEITAVCLIEHNNYMILGTSEGHVMKVLIKNGEIVQQWDQLFNEEIIKIAYDETSNLLHIFNIDSSLKCLPLQHLNVRKDNVNAKDKRALRQLMHHSQVNICTFNLSHGLLITSNDDFITIWNLEYYSVVIQIQLEEQAIATSIVISNNKQYFIVGTNQAQLYFISITSKNDHYVCAIESILNVESGLLMLTSINEKNYATQMLIDDIDLIVGLNNGYMLKYDISELKLQHQDPINTKPNYNPYRVIYHNSIQEHFIDNYRILNSYLVKDINMSQHLIQLQRSPNQKIKQKFRTGMTRLSAVKSMAGQFYDQHFENPNQSPTLSVSIHSESVIQLSYMQIDPFEVLFSTKTQLIISASSNDIIKIINKQFEVLCLFEINNPTSHFWNLNAQTYKLKAHILFALELLKSIQHKLTKEKQMSYNIDNILRECSLIYMKNKYYPSKAQSHTLTTNQNNITSSLPDLINKSTHSLRFYNEKIKYQKQQLDIQQQEKQIEDSAKKRNRYFQTQQLQSQKKEILDYLRSDDKQNEHDDFAKTLISMRMRTEPKSNLQISKITRTTNFTEMTNRSQVKFPNHSKEVFNLIKQVIASPSKRFTAQEKSELKSKLKIPKMEKFKSKLS
ncbi:unnamed protein product (macronuclear) [Paramecium tetraurelia]|uniref:Uncharacterized protein n=1 Tax=Paramecium tetraurelia TaxID=5888 RepID=A0DLH7_PARTE|nr:uncharacterized protein GSPATT00018211001 [Paramecium tetraurelia]CAK83894.1 unnamed protein product [Paramecium tetraurelia]|eukprot:XP_001451291.1 hypothetical protein (macronuclear) [Paramecium tetraurelia strain d4-2]